MAYLMLLILIKLDPFIFDGIVISVNVRMKTI